MRGSIVLALAMAAAPVSAQDAKIQDGGVWKRSGDTIALPAAGIRVPTKAGTLVLVKTGEFSHPGEGLDNHAQYESADKQVFATAYVYRPTLADAALAAYATDRAVHQRFGSGVAIAEQGSVAVDGRPGTAIRTIYTGAQLEPGKPLATAAAFATVGGWTVKLRATGPADRRAEVVGALDALIAGLTVDPKTALRPTRPMAFDAPCPPAAGALEAKVFASKGIGADALIGAVLGGTVTSITNPGETAPPPFPGEGATRACVRGTIRLGQTAAHLIQPAGQANPDRVLAALSDSGTILEIGKLPIDANYGIKLNAIGQVDNFTQLDRQPTPAQLQGWLSSPNARALNISSRTLIDATGKQRIVLPGGGTGEARSAGKK